MLLLMAFMTTNLGGKQHPFPQQPDIYLEVIESRDYRGDVFFFAPHENERVVNGYLAEKIAASKGRFVILRQNGERHLKIAVGDTHFEVDPNRIFSKRGAANSLLRLNSQLKKGSRIYRKALKRSLALGRFILKQAGPRGKHKTIVAIHNNTDGYSGDGKGGKGTISIHRYRKKLEAGARYIKEIHQGTADEDDLFFITSPKHMEVMKKTGWHVLLQHPQVATIKDEDDGSLSVLSEKKGWPYINIEAQRDPDHLEEQKQMVDFVYDLVMTKPGKSTSH